MTQPSSIAKELSSGHGDRRIRVLIEEGKGFAPTAFSETEVERVVGIGAERSALVLRSGVKIPVALSFEQLEQKIYEPSFRTDGPVLDLRDMTGPAAMAADTDKASNVGNTNDVAKPKTPANTDQAPAPGDKTPDGTVYAGISPDTGKAMYAAPADASLTMTFNGAKEYAQGQNTQKAYGHDDWRVPTKAELNVLFNNRAAIGGFNVSGSFPSGWHWSSSSLYTWIAWGQRFSDGYQGYIDKRSHSSVRCVR